MSSTPRPSTQELTQLAAEHQELVRAAAAARGRALARYSGYQVGAAVRADGTVVPGCNVEISSYGLTMCAERVALFAAIARGLHRFEAIAVVGPGLGEQPTPPCGACRQVLWDLAGDVPVLLASPAGKVQIWSASALFPAPFDPQHLAPPGGVTE